MKAKNTNAKTRNSNTEANGNKPNAAQNGKVEVLYQRMGDRWFAFSLVDDEVFVGSISPEELEKAQAAKNGVYKISGNS